MRDIDSAGSTCPSAPQAFCNSRCADGFSLAAAPIAQAGPADRQSACRPPLTPAALRACLDAVIAAASHLPHVDLMVGQRMALSAHLFAEAPLVVLLTADCLEEDRALFPDIPLSPHELRQRQLRATGFRQLRDAFLMYARRADDAYLYEQSQGVQQALSVVRQVRADAVRPYPVPNSDLRKRAMGPVERVLADRQAKKKHNEKLNRQADERAKKRAADGSPPSPPQPRSSPQAKAMKEYRDQLALAGALLPVMEPIGCAAGPAHAAAAKSPASPAIPQGGVDHPGADGPVDRAPGDFDPPPLQPRTRC